MCALHVWRYSQNCVHDWPCQRILAHTHARIAYIRRRMGHFSLRVPSCDPHWPRSQIILKFSNKFAEMNSWPLYGCCSLHAARLSDRMSPSSVCSLAFCYDATNCGMLFVRSLLPSERHVRWGILVRSLASAKWIGCPQCTITAPRSIRSH